MFIAVLTGFSWFALCVQFSACLTWTKYPDSVTPVWNGTTVALMWDYTLTTEEQNAAILAFSNEWNRGNESHLEFVASKNFITGQSLSYVEDFAPHITISRSKEATSIINEVAKEDEGVYKFTVRFLTLGNLVISRNFSLEVRERRKHDVVMFTDSTHLDQLHLFANSPWGDSFYLYGDPANPLRIHIQAPFRARALTPLMMDFSKSMSTVRESVEWLFNDIATYFKFIDFKKKMKIGLSSVGKMYVVCAILRNALTCLYGIQNSRFFELDPPSLHEYFV